MRKKCDLYSNLQGEARERQIQNTPARGLVEAQRVGIQSHALLPSATLPARILDSGVGALLRVNCAECLEGVQAHENFPSRLENLHDLSTTDLVVRSGNYSNHVRAGGAALCTSA